MAVNAVASRIAKSSGDACRLHRIYKISGNGLKYIGQTNRLPEERFKEHARESSKCTLLKEALKISPASIRTLAVVGPHQVDVFERIAIAMENTVTPDGLNMTIGGPGVKRRDEKYEKLRHDVSLVRTLLATGKFVSYDMLFMKGMISMTEEEFNTVKRLM
jgi:hypothetical protein